GRVGERSGLRAEAEVVDAIERDALRVEMEERSDVVRVPSRKLVRLEVAADAPGAIHGADGVDAEVGAPLTGEVFVLDESEAEAHSVVRGEAAEGEMKGLPEDERLTAIGELGDLRAGFQGVTFTAEVSLEAGLVLGAGES